MNSFTNYSINKAHIFRLQRSLQLSFVLFFLFAFQSGQAQCPIIDPVPSITICSGSITSIALTSDQDPFTTFSWTTVQTDVVGSSNASGSTIIDTLTATDVFAGTVVYTITPYTAGCPMGGIPITVTITVNPIPLAIATPLKSTICSGTASSVALTSDVAGTTFTWTVVQAGVTGGTPGAGFSIAQTLNTTGPSNGIATYNIIPTANSCVGEPINAKVTVRQLPSLTLGPDPQVCQGTTTANLTYSATGGSPNQYSVDYDAAAEAQGFVDVVNAALPASPIVLLVPGAAAAGVYNAVLSVNNTVNGCAGASYPITVTVTAPIPQTITGTSPLCVGSFAIWTSTTAGGTWTSASPGIATVDINSGLVTGISAGTSIITYSVTVGGCVNIGTKTVTINASPFVDAGPDQQLCNVTVGTLAGNLPGGTGIGSWSVIAGGGTVDFPLVNNSTVSNLSIGVNTFRWTVTDGGCVVFDDINITVSAPATVANAGPDQNICSSTSNLAGNIPVVGSGTWTIIFGPGSITTPSSPNSGVTGLMAGTTTFRWTITNGACSSFDDVDIINGTVPIVNAGPDQALCNVFIGTLAGNTPAAGTGLWTVLAGGATVNIPNDPNSTVSGLTLGLNSFQWTITDVGCIGSDNIDIIVSAPPTIADAGLDQAICAVTATLAGNAPAVGTGLWTLIAGTGTITTPSSPTSGLTALGVGPNTFRWTISNAPCPASTDDVIITVSDVPTIANAGLDQAICAVTATLAGNVPAVGTGLWTLIAGTGTITTPSSPTSGLTALGVGPNTFRWTISNAPCPPSTDDVIITVSDVPTTADAGLDQAICAITATLAGNVPAVGTGLWTLIAGTGTITTPSSPTSGLTALGVGPNTFRWTISNAPCPPSTDDVIITVSDIPTIANAGLDQAICAVTATLAGNAPVVGTGLWTLIAGTGTITTPSSPTSGPTALGVGPNTFRWTISNAPCPPSTDDVIITVSDVPTVANAGLDQAICAITATLAGNAPVVGTGLWTLIAGSGTITTPSSPISGLTALGTGPNTFRWTISNAPCPPSTDDVIITVSDAPTIAAAGLDQAICAITATLAGNAPGVGTGLWTLIAGTGTITTPSSPISGLTGLGIGPNTFRWTISNAPCPASTDDVIITVSDIPTVANAGLDQALCAITGTLAGNAPVVGTGLWTLIAGSGTITTPTSPTSGLTALGTGPNTFRWTISNAPCPPSTDDVIITVSDAPTTADAGLDQSICAVTATLAGNAPAFGTGLWTLIAGTGTITTPSSPISGLTGLGIGPNTFRWTISNAPCPASTDDVIITVSDAPTVADAGLDQAICAITATLAGNAPGVGTGLWTLIAGTGTITTPSSPISGLTGLGVGPNTFRWTISNAPCAASTDDVIITVSDAPTTADAGLDQAICAVTTTLAGNAPAFGTGLWTLIAGTGTITTPSSPISGLTGLGIGPNTFRWTISNAPCPASTDDVIITVSDAPTVADAGLDQAICAITATLAGNAPGVGTGLWTLIAGTGTITTPSSPISGLTGLGIGPNTFRWTISNAPCPASTDDVIITVSDASTIADAGLDQAICAVTATLAGNAPVVGTGLWTLIAGTGTITTPSSPISGLTALGVGPNTFRWTISNAPCPASTDDVIITVSDIPTISDAGLDQAICAITATLAGNAPVVGTGLWTLIAGTGTITTPTSPISGLTALGVGPNTFRWTISNAPCPASTDDVIITVSDVPTIADAGIDQSICAVTAILAGNTPIVGTGLWTLIAGTGTITTPSSPTSGLTALGVGANTFRWTISNAPCPASTDDVIITVNSIDDASFTYSLATYCQTDVNPIPTVTGLPGGAFSSTLGLVFVSTATGEIDLAASTLGTYNITYTTIGLCPNTAIFSVTITTAPSAAFSYAGPYCQGGSPDPTPTFPVGSSAGTFSALPAGLVFISTATGQVDLTSSTPGIYTVTNTIAASGGCIAVNATSGITITALPVATFSYIGTPYCQNAVNPSPTFSGGGVAGTFSSTPGLVFVSTATGEVDLASSTPGIYTVTNTIAASGGCLAVISTSPITITALPIATFSYPGTPYCQNAVNPFPTFSGGGVAGTFSSTAGLVFVSTATGEVDLAASTAGPYTVTNTIAASGGCPAVFSTSPITINVIDDASFSYLLATFCQTGANPIPTVTGLPGGTFSSTAGLVFVSIATGEVNLVGSTLGTYNITYTTSGPCPNTAIFSLTITLSPDATFSYPSPAYCQGGVSPNPSPTFPPGSSAGLFSALPAGLVFVDVNTGQVDITASTPGIYTVTNFIAAAGGCPANSATSSITIDAVDDASFTYPSSTYCQVGINPTPIITGLPGGIFSSTIGLVFIDINTGEIDLAASTLGTYTINYTTSGPCPNTGVFGVTITLSPSAAFSYAGPYCQGGSPNPSPIFPPGSSAGTFSALPAGLVFVNVNTGQIDITASAPGTYSVTNTIAAAGGCPSDFSINPVTINDLPTIAAAGPDQTNAATCGLTAVTLAANAAVFGTGLWSEVSGDGLGSFVDATNPSTDFNGTAGITYVLWWTISNAPCTASVDSVTVTFNQAPSISDAGPDQISAATCGLTSVTLAANTPLIGTGFWNEVGGDGLGVFVDATSPTTVFNGTAGVTYFLSWTISNICGISSDGVVITFNQAPTTAAAGPDQTSSATCGLTSVTLAANTPVIGTGLWAEVSGDGLGVFVDATDPVSVFNGTTGITYVLSWTITNVPCVSADSVTITFNPLPTVVTNNPAAVCSPSTVDLTLAAVTAGSTGSLSFTYFTDALATASYLTPGAAVAGTYYIVGVTLAGCSDTTAVTVTVNSTPAVTVTGINLTCFNVCNGSAIATVVGGNPDFTYVWSSGPSVTKTATTDTITGLCIAGYTVTVTDVNGCLDVDSVTITQPTQLTPNITHNNITCSNVCDGISYSAPTGGTAPYTFSWNTGSVDTMIINLCPGTYTVIVTDSLGCSITATDTIVPAPSISANAVITNATCGLCDGQVTLSPSGGITPYTFLWGNGQTTNTESNLCAGLYSVNITDSIGCGSSVSIPIINPGGPTGATITSTNISCFGLCDGAVTALTPIGGTAPYSVLWIQSGLTTPTLNSLCAGVYYVQIADVNGCSFIDSVTITEPTQVIVNQFITAATCSGNDGSISIAPSGGAAPYTVLWSTGSTLDTITNLSPGFYSVQITDFVGCSQNIVIPLNSLNASALTTSTSSLLCSGSCNATATVVASGGTLPYSYLWNDPAAQTTDVATALCAGTYFVQVTNGGGCISFASVVITNPAPIGFGFANTIDPLCNGNNNGSITVIPFGGTLPYTFSWTSSGSVSDTASSLLSGVYTVTVTDANGCTAIQTNTLIDPSSLTISDIPTPASCNTIADGAIDVTVGGGTPLYTYQWSGGSSLTTEDLTNLLIGSYTVTVTDLNGCAILDTVDITSTITVLAAAGNDTAFCEPGTLLLNAVGSSANAVNFQWFQTQLPSDVLIGSVMSVSVTPPSGITNYYVIVDNGAGCAHNDTITVTLNPLPVANAGADVTILLSTSTVLGGNPTGPAGSTYIWTPSIALDNATIANPSANPIATTTYMVTVTSAQGCTSSDIVVVTVIANITFTNGISPNGDGANDEWIIDNIDLFPNCMVEIYNRWGELLFQSKGYTEKWSGVYKGQLLPVGTYYYIINLNDPLFPDAFTGPITILR